VGGRCVHEIHHFHVGVYAAGLGKAHHLAQIVDRYARATGHQSAIYAGSSDGGRSFGVVSLKWSSGASSEQQSRT